MNQIDTVTTDVLVIGSGGAGMRAAIAAADAGASVVLITKGRVGVSGATVAAVADVSVDSRHAADMLGLPGDRSDSPELFMEDMLRGGGELNDPRLVEKFVHEVPTRVKELLDWGATVRNFSISPGHRHPRAVIINGRDFAATLLRQLRRRESIRVIEQTPALDLALDGGRVCGAWALDMGSGRYLSISAKSTIVATGGGMNLFPVTTAPNDLLGDGIAMAGRIGAELRDMEFQTFLLGCAAPGSVLGNNYPYVLVCRCGGQMFNREGERFMAKTDPERMEKSTRDKVAIAATKEILEGRGGPHGGIWVSVRHIPDNVFEYYIQWYESSLGFATFDPKTFLPDLSRNAVEAIPAAHFWCGGIRIDEDCFTGIAGLYAAGECTGGLHGANRLSGNAMAEIITMGNIAGINAALAAKGDSGMPSDSYFQGPERILQSSGDVDPLELKNLIQKTAWETAGPIRNEPGLRRALDTVAEVRSRIDDIGLTCRERIFNREWLDALGLANMCDGLEAVALSALARSESRGGHYRSDCQGPAETLYNTYVLRENGRQTAIRRIVG